MLERFLTTEAALFFAYYEVTIKYRQVEMIVTERNVLL